MLRRMKENSVLPVGLAMSIGLGIGWWAHGGVNVHAAPAAASAPAQFQLSGDGSKLSVYYPNERMVYVYPAQSGSEHVYCLYSFHINAEGGPVDRENCPMGKLY